MTHDEIHHILNAHMLELFELTPDMITPDARLHDDLGIDSIDTIDLLLALKPHVGRTIPPEAFASVRTVNDVVHTVERLINEPK